MLRLNYLSLILTFEGFDFCFLIAVIKHNGDPDKNQTEPNAVYAENKAQQTAYRNSDMEKQKRCPVKASVF